MTIQNGSLSIIQYWILIQYLGGEEPVLGRGHHAGVGRGGGRLVAGHGPLRGQNGGGRGGDGSEAEDFSQTLRDETIATMISTFSCRSRSHSMISSSDSGSEVAILRGSRRSRISGTTLTSSLMSTFWTNIMVCRRVDVGASYCSCLDRSLLILISLASDLDLFSL